MRWWLQLAVFFLAVTASAQQAKRSYIFTDVVQRDDCNLLPQRSFEILPSLSRTQSSDRLAIQCGEAMDGTTLLSMTFFLTDTPPQKRGVVEPSHSYDTLRRRTPTSARFGRAAATATISGEPRWRSP